MLKRVLTLFTVVVAVGLASSATAKKVGGKTAGPIPDKAYLQKIWDGWSTLNPLNTAQFYAGGQHTFFDIAPLKYDSWDEYQKGVVAVLADYTSGTCTLNDDVQLHPAGDYVWGTATVKAEMKHKSGKIDMVTFRWTVVFANQDGKWLIVHEHVSEALQ
jgi:ketosteroid isomerase-like protein